MRLAPVISLTPKRRVRRSVMVAWARRLLVRLHPTARGGDDALVPRPSLPAVALPVYRDGERSFRYPRPSFPAPSITPQREQVLHRDDARGLKPVLAASQGLVDAVPCWTSTVPLRAVAVAHEAGNAVGTLELSLTPTELVIQFLRISTYSDGYIPYPMTSSQQVRIPFAQIAQVRVDGDGLVHLTLDPACTPYHRLVLAGLARDPSFSHALSYRRRSRLEQNITRGALVAWIPIAMILSASVPSLGRTFAFGFAVSIAAVVHTLRRDLASKWVLFNSSALRVRDEFLTELTTRLGPRVSRIASEQVGLAAEPYGSDPTMVATELPMMRGLLATAGVAAVVALVGILVGKDLLSNPPQQRSAQDNAGAPTFVQKPPDPSSDTLAFATQISADQSPAESMIPPCLCERSDSALWSDGIPRLSVFSRNRAGRSTPEKPSLYPEIAIVNNVNEDLHDVVLSVDFLVGPRNGRSARVTDREDLFWEGKLAPGRAVRWRVKGRGDDYVVTSYVSGRLGDDGLKAAPADAFWKLLTARTPAVRLHGATMLAYLGDTRADEALRIVRDEERGEQTSSLEMLEHALRPLRTCGVRAIPTTDEGGTIRVEACIFNASAQPKVRPMVTARVHQGESVDETRWIVETAIPPGAGRLATHFMPGIALGLKDDAEPQVEIFVEP